MYDVKDALIIYYDFADTEPKPRPFEDGGFAPEPPVSWRPTHYPPPAPEWPGR
jgi:hypothetical protein